jgi:5-methylcytosine-specific restriction protein A
MPTRPPIHIPFGHEAARDRRIRSDRERGSSTQRGYDRHWSAFRSAFIASHPLCSDCQAKGRLTATEEVHHVIKLRDRPDLRLVETNCLGLCRSCHSRRTANGE